MKTTTLKKIVIAVGIAAASLSQGAHAADYYFDYTYDGTNTFTNLSAAGSSFIVGDTINATYRAAGAGYWTAPTDATIWTPQGINESGTRTGDLFWTFSNNGSEVDSASDLGSVSQYVHIPGNVHVNSVAPIQFDELVWKYTLTEVTFESQYDTVNTLNGGTFNLNWSRLNPESFEDNGVSYVAAPVPEPETYAMMLAGLGLLGFVARRRKQKLNA